MKRDNRRKKVIYIKRFAAFMLSMLCILGMIPQSAFAAEWNTSLTLPSDTMAATDGEDGATQGDDISAVVMDLESGTILYERNMDITHYPASITKIMTALLTLENCSNLQDTITFSSDAVYKTAGGSSIARDVGEQMTVEQTLYGMMLESANECAYALAEYTGGSMDNFVAMMNQKAADLGCTNTHFTNSSGLPDEEHVTTAHDMALIAKAAYENETFRTIVGTATYQIPPTNKHDEITYLNNHHAILHPYKHSSYVRDWCKGGKTGYTEAANNTLVTYGESNGMKLVTVVMNEEGTNVYKDTISLMEHFFNNYTAWNICANEESADASVFDTSSGYFTEDQTVSTSDTGAYVILPNGVDFSQVEKSVEGNEIIYTYDGLVVGRLAVTVQENKKETESLEQTSSISGDAQDKGSQIKDGINGFFEQFPILLQQIKNIPLINTLLNLPLISQLDPNMGLLVLLAATIVIIALIISLIVYSFKSMIRRHKRKKRIERYKRDMNEWHR
jgi:serine-type D-Ala-D-Ala carboxypeptidase (penicillin-binding protein 5/6)